MMSLGQKFFIASCLTILSLVLFSSYAFAHGDGNGGGKDLVKISFIANPSVPEFASAQGTARVNLSKGIIELEELEGFPFNTERNRILPVDLTSTTDPRLKGHDGEPGGTSCHEAEGKWSCHAHSYVVWLAELEDGALGHPIPLGTIYPRTNGTAAERNFTFREGDLLGFGANVLIITAEVTFGPLPSMTHGHDGREPEIQLVPRGPIVMQANLP